MQQCVRRGCPDQQVVNDQIAEKKVIDFTNENLGPVFSESQAAALSAILPCMEGACTAMEMPASVTTTIKSSVRNMFRKVLMDNT